MAFKKKFTEILADFLDSAVDSEYSDRGSWRFFFLTLGILGTSNFRHFKYFIGINFQMVYSGPVFQKMNTASVILSYQKSCIYDFLAGCNREEI